MARPWVGAPRHTTIVNNVTIINHIRLNIGYETRRDYYYWHQFDGISYSHYYDMYGSHWYGFYMGPTYYWTRYHDGRFWWFDPRWSRWVYWHQQHWWYQDPVNITIIYINVNDQYYRYDDVQNGVVLRPEPVTAPPQSPAQPQPEQPAEPVNENDNAFYSTDGTRLVQVYGERQEAFLYALDVSEDEDAEPVFLAYLAGDVSEVRFSNTEDGSPLRILCLLKDGTFALFDAEGQAVGQPAAEDKVPEGGVKSGSLTSLQERVGKSIENIGFDSAR
ncbi:MAG: hypothetical protein HZB91_11335 [Elusimicrobia bacterium]|nr:hypothetical protein [Elusimicrobiota bacterium]